jgi:hypothetical protein
MTRPRRNQNPALAIVVTSKGCSRLEVSDPSHLWYYLLQVPRFELYLAAWISALAATAALQPLVMELGITL